MVMYKEVELNPCVDLSVLLIFSSAALLWHVQRQWDIIIVYVGRPLF